MRRAMRNLTLTVVSLSVVAVVTGVSVKERGVPGKAIKGVSASWVTLMSLSPRPSIYYESSYWVRYIGGTCLREENDW